MSYTPTSRYDPARLFLIVLSGLRGGPISSGHKNTHLPPVRPLAEIRWNRLARGRLEAEALEVTELRILAELAKGPAPGPQTSLVKLLGSSIGQKVDTLGLERPLYGHEALKAVGSEYAQTVTGKYLNNRASTIFGGSDEVQKNIIAKSVLGL